MSEDTPSVASVVARRLREFRERLHVTQSALSGKTGIGVSSLSDFENGKREPTLSQLKKLAACLEADISAFLSLEEPTTAVVRWRQRPLDAEIVEARFLKLCRQYRDLELWTREEEPVRLRRVDQFPATQADVFTLAELVRGEMQLGDRPGLGLHRKLEDDYAVKIFHVAVEPSGSAACTNDPQAGPAVLLNPLNSHARRTFDLAHELFHLLTWGLAEVTVDTDTDESFANKFASMLLLPETALRAAVERRVREGRLSSANLWELARDFSVSIDALIWRLHRIYGWRDEQTKTMIAEARRLLRPYRQDRSSQSGKHSDARAPELPERYRTLAIQALRSGEISIGRFAEYMGLRRWEAMKYADEASGDESLSLPGL